MDMTKKTDLGPETFKDFGILIKVAGKLYYM